MPYATTVSSSKAAGLIDAASGAPARTSEFYAIERPWLQREVAARSGRKMVLWRQENLMLDLRFK